MLDDVPFKNIDNDTSFSFPTSIDRKLFCFFKVPNSFDDMNRKTFASNFDSPLRTKL